MPSFAAMWLASLPALAASLSTGANISQSQVQREHSAGRFAVAHVTQGETQSLFGILAMHNQLKQFNSKADHVVFVSDDAPGTYVSLLEAIGVHTIKYNPREIGDPLKVCPDCWAGTFQKLTALVQSEYSSVVVLDYDVHAMANFDEVFSYESPGMVSWCIDWEGEKQNICAPNSGVFLVKPDRLLLKSLISSFSHLKSEGALRSMVPGERTFSDQSFLREFFYKGYHPGHNITQLPRTLNARSADIDWISEEAKKRGEKVKLVHFTLHKPYKNGFEIRKQVKEGTMLADILCETTRAAQATLEANKAKIGKFGNYDLQMVSWETLAGDPDFANWAHHHCKGLPRTSGADALKIVRKLHR